jgi:sialic acid synthase SpsE
MQWISDIGSNHNQDISRIEKLIIATKKWAAMQLNFSFSGAINSAALYIKELSKKGE